MMQEFIKFTDVTEPVKAADSRSYDEINYEAADELTKALNEALD